MVEVLQIQGDRMPTDFSKVAWYEATCKCSVPMLCPGIGCVLATPLLCVFLLWQLSILIFAFTRVLAI